MKHSFLLLFCAVLALTGCDELDPREPGYLVPKTVDQDASVASITVNNTQFHAEAFGDPVNTMVVVLHGGPGADYRSLLNCRLMADHGYYVVFYDQRGSGLSRRESKSVYTGQLMLDDLTAVIAYYRNTPDQKVILLGHSWGAMLATSYINRYPTAVQGAILAEPGGFVWSDVKDYVSRAQGYGLTSETLNDVTYADQFFTGTESEQEKLDYKFGLSASADVSGKDPVGNGGFVPFWRYGAVVSKAMFDIGERDKPNWTGNLSAFTSKVLFIYSERNSAYGLTYAQHVSSAYPNVQLARVDGAGHEMINAPTGWNNFLPIALTYLNEVK